MNGEKKIFVGLLEKVVSFLHQGKPQFVKDADEGKFRQLRALRASLVAKKEELKKASPADRPAIKTAILKNKDELKLYNFFHWLDTEAERQRLTKLLTRSRELRADYLVQKAARAKDLRLLAPVKAAFMEKFASLKADHKAALKDIKALKALDNETAEKFEARKKAACAAEKASYEAKFEALNKESAAASLAAAPDARKHLFALETDKDALHLARVSFKQDLVDQDVILSVRHMKQFFDMGGGDKTKAVHDVSFDIKRNECFGLVGESGCGKTTTGRCIIKLYDITSGAVYYEGYRISGGPRFNLKEIKWSRIHAKEKTAKLKEKKKLEIASIPLKSYEIEAKIADLNAREAAEIKEKSDPQDVDGEDLITSIKNDYAKRRTELEVLREAASCSEAEQRKKIESFYDGEIQKVREEEKIHVHEQKEELRHIKYDDKHSNSLRLPDELPADANMANIQSQPSHRLVNEIQMIFQDPVDSLDPRMTVNEIIQEGLHIQGHYNKAENEKKVAGMLDKVGLIPEYASRYPHEFSGGQRQRIGIARAVVMNPKFLICDEPISALDVSIRAQILNLLNDVKEEMGVTILFIAHDLSVVKYFCDRIAVMYYGNMVELASSDELFRHPLHPYTKSLLSAIPKPDPASEKNRIRIVYKPSEVHDYSKDKPSFQEIIPGHLVLANSAEMAKYREEIAAIDTKAAAEKH